jgi:LmbE family N-acetylglucosaminyl deacetylase
VKLFISPHNDDETLFGAFTILRENPLVVVVYDSHAQFLRGEKVTAHQRRQESSAAMKILGADVEFCGLSDQKLDMAACIAALRIYEGAEEVWAPAFERNGNPHHNLIARAVDSIFPHSQRYMTYTSAGKSSGVPVPIKAGWTLSKLRALACYESQIELAATRDFFLNDQREYYKDGRRRFELYRQLSGAARRMKRARADLARSSGDPR